MIINAPNAFARFISNIVTGNKRRRVVMTPFAALIFFGFITLFIFAGLSVDKWLALPSLAGWWKYIVSSILFFLGLLVAGCSLLQFAQARGSPVPLSPPPKLITSGIYSYVRNPMISGGLLLLEGLGFLLGSLSVIIVFAPLPVLLYAIFIITIEERELAIRFGEEYREYMKKVPRFIPRLRR